MKLLDKEGILRASDLSHEDVPVPEWGGTVRVRVLTGTERAQYEQMSLTQHDGRWQQDVGNYHAKLLVLCLIDENGHRLFAENEIEVLGAKSAKALSRVLAVAQRINALGPAAEDAAGKN